MPYPKENPLPLAKFGSPGEGAAASSAARAAKREMDAALSEEGGPIDLSLAASKLRLQEALALGSVAAKRAARRGMHGQELDQIQKLAAIWKTLNSDVTVDPLEQRPGETTEEYKARLERLR